MKFNLPFCFLLFLSSINYCSGQKIHYSNYNYAPLVLSPAHTGAFHGTIRVGGTMREQFRGFIEEPFQSVSAYIDSPISFIINERQWIGVGGSFSQASAGDLALQETSIVPSLAYHLSFDDDYTSIIGLGVSYALNSRRVKNPDAFRSEDMINGTVSVSPDKNFINDLNVSHSGLSIGLYGKKIVNDKVGFSIGFSLLDIYNSGYQYNTGVVVNKAPARLNAYLNMDFGLSENMIFSPALVFQTHDKVYNVMGIGAMEHIINKGKNLRFNYRLGYRLKDAILFGAGIKINSWDVGMSYDMTVSSAQPHNGMTGALELGVKKIIIINPKTKVKTLGLCPRL